MSSVQMYRNVIGRVPQRSYFVAIVLGPTPTKRGKVSFHGIKSSICIWGGGSWAHFHFLWEGGGGGGGYQEDENKISGRGGGGG